MASVALGWTASAAYQPSIPSTFFGTVAIDGKAVPAGTEVRAFVSGKDCTQGTPKVVIEGGVSVYSLAVVYESQVEGCGKQGSAVTFQVSARAAGQSGTWTAGIAQLDLNVGNGSPIPLPTATAVPTPDRTQAAATATEAAKFTPVAVTSLPTDQPFGDGTLPAGIGGQSTTPKDSGGTSVFVLALGVIGALGLAGALAGLILSKRRPAKSNGRPGDGAA